MSPPVDPTEPDSWEADVVLRDGHTVRMRAIRPDDADRIQRFHERQSPESIYFRFFSPRPTLSDRDVEHFTNVDHIDRVAFVAVLDEEIVAVARYERYEGTDTAEVAFFVDDAHHGRGLASLMLEYLAAAARENGIVRFRASTLPNNRKMLKVFAVAGYDVATQLDDGLVDIAFDLTPTEEVVAAVDRRGRIAEAASVRRLLCPAAVALVADDGSFAANIAGGGYQGDVVVLDHSDIDDLPEGTDLVVLAGRPASVSAVIEVCGQRGAGAVVVVPPLDDDETAAVLDVVRRHGLRLLGPASAGVLNTDSATRLHAMADGPETPVGSVGLLSGSGDVVAALVDHARRVGLGLSTVVSAEGSADVNVADLLSYWADDDDTSAVMLHLGSAPLPARFVRAARAASLLKPVVALRASTPARGPLRDVAWQRDDAMLRQGGVIGVETLQQMFAVGRLLNDQPPPGGRRVAVVGSSDGAVELAASACTVAGLEVAERHRGPTSHIVSTLAVTADDPDVHSVLVVDTTPGARPPDELAEAILATSRAHPELTIVVSTIGGERPIRLVDTTGEVAVPVFTYPEHAAAALGRLVHVQEWRSTARVYGADVPPATDADAARDLVQEWRAASGVGEELLLDHDRCEQLLATFGVVVADRHTVSSVEEAVDSAERLGWPIALKANQRDRGKRTALGGVALDVAGADDLRATWNRMVGVLGEEGMLPAVVQRLLEEGLDIAVRVRRVDAAPTVEVGLGGPATAFDHWELGVVPLTLPDASALVTASSIGRALTDPLDRVPVVALLHRLAALVDAVDEIHEVVADPVVVSGPNAWITDVQIVLGDPRGELPVRHLG